MGCPRGGFRIFSKRGGFADVRAICINEKCMKSFLCKGADLRMFVQFVLMKKKLKILSTFFLGRSIKLIF